MNNEDRDNSQANQADYSLVIAKSLHHLEEEMSDLREVALEIAAAFEGAFYAVDMLALAAVNRTLHLQPAFQNAVDNDNFLVVGSLLRLHLDSCLRLYAAWLVDDPHGYALSVLEGTPTYKLRDSKKQRMTDTYLVSQLGLEHTWMPAVYQKCSEFVHLSNVHIKTMFTREFGLEDGASFEMRVGFGSVKRASKRYFEAVEAFRAIDRVLKHLLDGWLFTKSNPHEVQRLKRTRSVT